MTAKRSTSKTEIAIFDDTFNALTIIDEEYRRDSELSFAQRDLHEERIEHSQAEIERLKKTAEVRDAELTARRRKITAAALKLYSMNPEISDDHTRVFNLVAQHNYGQIIEAGELEALTKGLTALNTAIANHSPILRTINGRFDSLIIPSADATGLVPIVGKHNFRRDEESVKLMVPMDKMISYNSGRQLPITRENEQENVLHDFMSYEEGERRHRMLPTPATIATSYDVHYGLRNQATRTDEGKQVTFVIGEELIQHAISSAGKKDSLREPDSQFVFKSWLASRAAGYSFTCDYDVIGELVVDSVSELLRSYTGYRNSGDELINSKPAKILLNTIREFGAEEQLFEKFYVGIAKYHGPGTIYSDRDVVRTIFDATMEISSAPSDG